MAENSTTVAPRSGLSAPAAPAAASEMRLRKKASVKISDSDKDRLMNKGQVNRQVFQQAEFLRVEGLPALLVALSLLLGGCSRGACMRAIEATGLSTDIATGCRRVINISTKSGRRSRSSSGASRCVVRAARQRGQLALELESSQIRKQNIFPIRIEPRRATRRMASGSFRAPCGPPFDLRFYLR